MCVDLNNPKATHLTTNPKPSLGLIKDTLVQCFINGKNKQRGEIKQLLIDKLNRDGCSQGGGGLGPGFHLQAVMLMKPAPGLRRIYTDTVLPGLSSEGRWKCDSGGLGGNKLVRHHFRRSNILSLLDGAIICTPLLR